MIHGCLCPPGFAGYDCSLRECPTGVDPGAVADAAEEEQLMWCAADDGWFRLRYGTAVTTKVFAKGLTISSLTEQVRPAPHHLTTPHPTSPHLTP